MPTYRRRVLALKKTKLGESDLIVTLLAEDGCQIRAVAKGARKTSSRFGARLEPYAVADVLLATGRSLEIVTDAETVSPHTALREDYDRSVAAAVVVDFLDKVSVECQAEERLFGLSVATLDVMETVPATELTAVVTAFLVKGMAMHGYRPQLESCAACGEPVAGAARFSPSLGGPLCAGCTTSDLAATAVSADARIALSAMLQARMADVAALAVPPPLAAECLALMRGFIAYHVNARMKALDLWAAAVARTV